MVHPERRLHLPWLALLALALASLVPRPAAAADIGVFVSGAEPGAFWGHGFGGYLGITLFNVIGLEIEGAKQNGEVPDSSMLSLSGRAFLAPSFGRFVPYGGLSIGGFRETLGSEDDWKRRSSVFLGAKLKFPLGLTFRAEYEWVDVASDALIPMDRRYYGGVGFSF
jgi:hypothetical protein